MSEIDARPPPTRGRSSHRGGRGGFGRGGPRGGSRKPVNGTSSDAAPVEDSFEDQGELGEMKKKYATELPMLKDMFPDWTDVDLVFALQEADGDVPATVDKITQGNVSQFAEVKSAKDRARSKVKEPSTTAGAPEKSAPRGGRGRGGLEGTRGGRGRGSDRGRGGGRGGRAGHATTNGAAKDTTASVPTSESTAWDDSSHVATAGGSWDTPAAEMTKDSGDTGQSAWADVMTADSTPATESEGAKSSLIPEGGPKKSWASMFAAKRAPATAPVTKTPATHPPPAELVASGHVAPAVSKDVEALQPLPAIEEPEAAIHEPSPLEQPSSGDGAELLLTPSKDPLTEENVEHLPDESHPPATQTAASTTGSIDPRNVTPLPGQQAPIARPPLGGYALSAHRAAGMPGRSASYQRRVQEQQEAVVMPGHNAVDRAAVQFGSMGMNGEPGPDVDDDREEPETRHAPQPSPPSQLRTSLPPAPRQTAALQEPLMPENLPTPKQAPGLPPASQHNQQQIQEAAMAHSVPAEMPQVNQSYNQYSRYGQPGMQQDSGAQHQQKAYDSFSHQTQPSQYDQYGTHTQQAPHQQQQTQAGFGGLSSAPNDFSSYYTSDHQRGAYNNYYGGSYGPQDVRSQIGQSQQDTGMGQQRSTSGFGATPNESAFASQVQQQQAQSRFGDAAGSGHNTPNPPLGAQQQQPQPQQQTGLNAQQSQTSMHQAPGHQQQGAYGTQPGYPYGHQYYNSPYPQAYLNHYGYGNQGGGYGAYPAKHSMYGGSHGYGVGPQPSYEQHSASPANAGAFGQNQQSGMRSASGMSAGLGGLDDYGRGSAQAHQQSSGFGSMNDPYGRSGSGFGSQAGYGQQSMAGQEDSLKPFSDSKGGPSPALGQPGRPGSAANSAGGTAQSGLPPPQSHQSGFGAGYPGFASQGQQGLGGLGTQQQQQQQHGQGGYGGYGAGGFNQTYGSYGSRGGWGSSYGAH